MGRTIPTVFFTWQQEYQRWAEMPAGPAKEHLRPRMEANMQMMKDYCQDIQAYSVGSIRSLQIVMWALFVLTVAMGAYLIASF
jgi:hypothetical protein